MKLTVEDVKRVVAAHYRITVSDLLARDRHRSVAFPRHLAMYLARSLVRIAGRPMSFPELGAAFGNRDHTTVMSAVVKVEGLRAHDVGVRATVQQLEDEVRRAAIAKGDSVPVGEPRRVRLLFEVECGCEVVTREVVAAHVPEPRAIELESAFASFVAGAQADSSIEVRTSLAVRTSRESKVAEDMIAGPSESDVAATGAETKED